MQTWEQWIQQNKPKLKHPVDFEERFVREILTRIPEIDPSDVIAQYHFQDFNGGNCYIDFCIRNDSKGYFVSIELDGKNKFGYESIEATLERQNIIMAKKLGTLLRFANSTWLNKPDQVIQSIRIVLRDQHKAFKNQIAKDTLAEQIKAYENELSKLKNNDEVKQLTSTVNALSASLKNQNGTDNTQDIHRVLLGLTQQVSTLPHVQNTIQPPAQTKNNSGLIIGAVLGVLGLGAAALSLSQKTKQEPTPVIVKQTKPVQQMREIPNPLYEEPKPETQVEIKAEPVNDSSPKPETKVAVVPTPKPIAKGIPSAEAAKYINTYQTVCGNVAEVKELSGRTYINLGNTYPNQDIGIIVWSSDVERVAPTLNLRDSELCVKGKITTYQGSVQMKLSHPSQVVE